LLCFGLLVFPTGSRVAHHFKTDQKFDITVLAANRDRAGTLRAFGRGNFRPLLLEVFAGCVLAVNAIDDRAPRAPPVIVTSTFLMWASKPGLLEDQRRSIAPSDGARH
jgi:hypothetical protein